MNKQGVSPWKRQSGVRVREREVGGERPAEQFWDLGLERLEKRRAERSLGMLWTAYAASEIEGLPAPLEGTTESLVGLPLP